MRKITEETCRAFHYNREIKMSNTSVKKDGSDIKFYLHGNLIAIKSATGSLKISNAGWQSNTTKERLNGILSYEYPASRIFQKNHQWYITGVEVDAMKWDGRWVYVK